MDRSLVCHGIFIKGNVLTTVAHVLSAYEIPQLRVQTIDGQLWRIKIESIDEASDKLDLRIDDKTFQPKRDISSHLAERGFVAPPNSHAVLVTLYWKLLDTPTLLMRAYRVSGTQVVKYANTPGSFHHISYVGHRAGFSSTGVQTTSGDCGSILLLAETSWTTGKIIGMHAAASTAAAYARHIYRDHYNEVRPEVKTREEIDLPEEYFAPYDQNGAIAKSKFKVHIPDKTRLYRNWIPLGPKLFEPSILSGSDSRNPGHSVLRSEALKWCKDRQELPPEIVTGKQRDSITI